MINRVALLSGLQKLLQRLEADLLERSESTAVPEIGIALRAEYDRAKTAERTAQNYEDWRTDAITQAAAAWVLSCVFVRFLEDNRLIDPPKIAGLGERLTRARDEWELYLSKSQEPNERDYLLTVFDQLAKMPGTRDVFGEHNPIRELPNWLSGDAAKQLLDFFQRIDANNGVLVHDFTDPNGDTRFLGDLYQDLSEAARKKYALLQTPEFVEEFILDRTLEPALDEFGLEPHTKAQRRKEDKSNASSSLSALAPLRESLFKMIDPACGSGHFLLGAFRRILERWQRREPGTNVRELVQRTLDSVHGVDVNPFAIAIARFRLLLAAMRACGIARLADAPAFRLNLACGDSLLHAPLAAGGKKYTAGQQELDFALARDPADSDECDHAYRSENLPELKRLLRGGQYHAVVANPPYITPKDKQLNERYRRRFKTCHRQYSLAVPFLERIFQLAVDKGFTGQITANTFMKAEFGKTLVESFFPKIDLTTIFDSSTAYIPGHGTPTLIILGRQRLPLTSTVRIVAGGIGEPQTPKDPSLGIVWTTLVASVDKPGFRNAYVSVSDSPRERLLHHPWSIGGGGAAELKDLIDGRATHILGDETDDIGRSTHTGEDAVFCLPSHAARRTMLFDCSVPLVIGEDIRDYIVTPSQRAIFPYDKQSGNRLNALPAVMEHYFWPCRTILKDRMDFGQSIESRGLRWYEHSMFFPARFRSPTVVAMAFVATHNHYVIDSGSKLFKQTSPVINPQPGTNLNCLTEWCGFLNSSLACFWLKSVCFPKGGDQVGREGARVRRTLWDEHYNFNATPLKRFPIVVGSVRSYAERLTDLGDRIKQCLPNEILDGFDWSTSEGGLQIALKDVVENRKATVEAIIAQMIHLQEELDWYCYRLYGLIDEDITSRSKSFSIQLGQRAFEIVLARKMAAGETQTTWFERHGSTPIIELPAEWPDDYRQLVERRIALIESDPNIRLIEQPEYKRRWNTEPWDSQLERALREWLLDRLEGYFDFDGRMKDLSQRREGAKEDEKSQSLCTPAVLREISLYSVAKLADVARQDTEFQQVGELFRDDLAFDVQKLVEDLVAAECVPLLPVLRYKPSGLIKRGVWERTWDLQRQEDAIDARTKLPSTDPQHLSADAARDLKQKQVGNIPVPSKYDSKDFLDSNFWRLRGKLDVPKERWISFPHCEGPDGTPVIAWAGYDHLQQARAISAYYVRVQTEFGGTDDARLIPLLACLLELIPWLKQWHNEPDPAFDGMRMGDYFEGFVNEEARQLNKTIPEIKGWTPPKKVAKGQRGKVPKVKQE